MAHVIGNECTKCGSCAETCPFEAISEGENSYVIDPDKCTDCGLCAEQCPAQAIREG
ncbi:MAG TPA: 4Fe-4S binding protein [Firmicutes bacterium]|nr:4Fe-4S binding protein [Bacillota bacterium]